VEPAQKSLEVHQIKGDSRESASEIITNDYVIFRLRLPVSDVDREGHGDLLGVVEILGLEIPFDHDPHGSRDEVINDSAWLLGCPLQLFKLKVFAH
jgi:hypothetical protein